MAKNRSAPVNGRKKKGGAIPLPAPKPTPRPAPPPPPPAPAPVDASLAATSSLATVRIQKAEWLWQGFVPDRTVTLITGPSEVGKTCMLARLAAHLSSAGEIFDSDNYGNCRIAWLSIEDNPRLILRPRLLAAGAVLENILLPDYDQSGKLCRRTSFPTSTSGLIQWLHIRAVSLLVIDPIDSFLDDSIAVNDPVSVRTVMDSLHLLASEAECAVLLTKHPRKGRSGGPLDWVSGSAAWTQAARKVLLLDRHPDRRDQFLIASIKCTLGSRVPPHDYRIADESGQPVFILGEPSDSRPEELAERGDLGEQEERSDAVAWIKAQLSEPRESGVVFRAWQQQGYATRLWWRLRRKLGIVVKRVGPKESQQTLLELPPPAP